MFCARSRHWHSTGKRTLVAPGLEVSSRLGRIVAVAITPGNIADISMAMPLLEAIAPAKRLLADKAYDADRLRNWLGDMIKRSNLPRGWRAMQRPVRTELRPD
jgi:IS5 family transposase